MIDEAAGQIEQADPRQQAQGQGRRTPSASAGAGGQGLMPADAARPRRIEEIRLDGRVAIVTGAARGLGKAMATALARAGAATVFADLDEAALAATVGGLEEKAKARALRCDITDRHACEKLVADTVAAFGALHILVNNAGKGPAHVERAPGTRSHLFWESDPEVWQQVIQTNVNGTFLMARSAVPEMLKARWGRIVNVTTSLGTMQRRANSPYGVSKTAIEAETLIWAQDLAGSGITVNSLIPGGAADTEFVSASSRRDLAAAGRTFLQPAVMVPPILWLASTLSDGVTGARLVGRLWDASLPPGEAAMKAREPQVLREVPAGER
jgi:NAD(P)-dependent dehydrogenase (short-subunit alcohol dehydrogenase family)